jgi:hypothetical protein
MGPFWDCENFQQHRGIHSILELMALFEKKTVLALGSAIIRGYKLRIAFYGSCSVL